MSIRLLVIHESFNVTDFVKATLQSWLDLEDHKHLQDNDLSLVLAHYSRAVVMGEQLPYQTRYA
jgi:predicted nucleotidyltransferase